MQSLFCYEDDETCTLRYLACRLFSLKFLYHLPWYGLTWYMIPWYMEMENLREYHEQLRITHGCILLFKSMFRLDHCQETIEASAIPEEAVPPSTITQRQSRTLHSGLSDLISIWNRKYLIYRKMIYKKETNEAVCIGSQHLLHSLNMNMGWIFRDYIYRLLNLTKAFIKWT